MIGTEEHIAAIREAVLAERAACAAWLAREAEAAKSGAGIAVPAEAASYARQRVLACASGVSAGLHSDDPMEGVAHG